MWSTLFSHFEMTWVMLDVLSTYLLVGGLLEGQGALQCGKLCLFASFGVSIELNTFQCEGFSYYIDFVQLITRLYLSNYSKLKEQIRQL